MISPEPNAPFDAIEFTRQLSERATEQLGRVVVGMDEVIRQMLIAILAGGHVLLEGVPGVAKTTLSKLFARILGCEFQRIQFTPDLLPSDVTGTSILDRRTNDFVLRKGPVFCQVLLADEINRAPAKTQSALLEAMQEYQATVDGQTLPLPMPFFVLATQNPIEQEGVYRLPEAQLDRFLLKIEVGYPSREAEVRMLQVHSKELIDLEPLTNPAQLLEIRSRIGDVFGKPELFEYIVALAQLSREHPDLLLGASPRASLSILKCSRARALISGRDYFTHEDVQAVTPLVLGHRLIIRPEAELEGKRVGDIVAELLASVPVMNGV